jgi:monoamine oxidase
MNIKSLTVSIVLGVIATLAVSGEGSANENQRIFNRAARQSARSFCRSMDRGVSKKQAGETSAFTFMKAIASQTGIPLSEVASYISQNQDSVNVSAQAVTGYVADYCPEHI